MKDLRVRFPRMNVHAVLLVTAVVAFCAIYYRLLLGDELFTHDSIIWYGSFHYYIDSMVNGHFPYWDPYLMAGTYFYPNISHHGLLDPIVLILVGIGKFMAVPPLNLYIYFRLFRLVIFALGAYYLYRHIAKSALSALASAIILFFAMPAAYFKQYGAIDVIYLTPFALLALVRYLECPLGAQKYLNLFWLALVTGISMNIYIPTFYLFNILVFLIVLLALRIVPSAAVTRGLAEGKTIIPLAAALLLIVLMMAPPLMVMFKDASGGELFPIVRIAQKNDGNLKQIIASDISSSNLSEKFYNEKGVFNSYGNIVNLLYPEMWNLPYFASNDYMAEINQYIGLIPLLICIIGVLYHTSKYRYVSLIMLIIMTLNMFSFEGMSNHPYNGVQQVFNHLFPPLKMAEGRETLGSFFLFYLCLLLSLGLSIFVNPEEFTNVLRKNYRQIIALCAAVVIAKIIITAIYGGQMLFASKQDLYSLLQVVVFAVLILLFLKGGLSKRVLYGIVAILVLSDLFLYNYLYKVDILVDRRVIPVLNQEMKERGNAFQYFRDPIVSPPGLAFGETILKAKGSLTYGNNHSLFSTKRYYDLLTYTSPDIQLALSGTIFPIVRYFPDGSAVRRVQDKGQLLETLSRATEGEVLRNLYIEVGASDTRRSHEIGTLSEYADITQYTPNHLYAYLYQYLGLRGAFIREMKDDLPRQLRTARYDVSVLKHSPNEITIALNNSEKGYLLYSDGWSRYWRAYDGDNEIPVLIANYNSKAVLLSPGQHRIRFVFDPVHYKIGLVLFYGGLLVATVSVVIFWIRARRSLQTPGSDVTGA